MTAETLVAFDFGERRVGVAVGNSLLRTAQSLTTLDCHSSADRFEKIAAVIAQWQPQRLVVGIPFAADGSEHEMTRRCRRFANQLLGRFSLPVATVDERYSSEDASERHRAARAAGHARARTPIDHLAAEIILERYFLEERREGTAA